MPADAYVMDADMKKVADAIRKKSGKTGMIVFPDGFVNEIGNMGSLKLNIVKNPTKPQVTELAPDLTGMQISVSDDVDTNTIVNYTTSPSKWGSTVGKQSLTVSFGGASSSVLLDVVAPYLRFDSVPSGDQIVGMAPNTSGARIVKVSGDNVVDVTSRCVFSPAKWSNSPGMQTLTASCDGLTVSTELNVVAPYLTITRAPTGLQVINEKPDVSGIEVKKTTGSKVEVVTSRCTYSPSKWTNSGSQTLTAMCDGLSATTKVTVYAPYLEITKAPTGSQMKGKAPNTDGMEVMKITGSRRENVTARCTFTPSIWTNEGSQRLTVYCDGLSAYTTVTVKSATIYGVKIQRSDSSPNGAVSYIDDATGFTPMSRSSPGSWAGNPLISGIKPVMRKSNGQWQDLNKRNLASGASISSVGNDVFTRFPTWWLSITSDGTYDYVRFSDQKADDTYYKLASLYNGVDQGMFHMGCYHAYNSGNKLYSSANKTPSVSISTENFRLYAQARGAGFDQVGYYQIMYLQALFVLLFKGRNGQELIGKGLTGGSKSSENRTTYDNDYGMAGSSSATDQMSFFWINNWWGNVYDFVGGAKTDGSKKLMTLDNGQPINTSGSGWVTQNSSPGVSGWTSKMDMKSTKTGFFPTEGSGSSSTYWCDRGYVRPSYFPLFGGYYNDGGDAGPFYWLFNYSASAPSSYIGSRLVYRNAVN